MYVDLLFDKTDDGIIMWFENLEENSRELILISVRIGFKIQLRWMISRVRFHQVFAYLNQVDII